MFRSVRCWAPRRAIVVTVAGLVALAPACSRTEGREPVPSISGPAVAAGPSSAVPSSVVPSSVGSSSVVPPVVPDPAGAPDGDDGPWWEMLARGPAPAPAPGPSTPPDPSAPGTDAPAPDVSATTLGPTPDTAVPSPGPSASSAPVIPGPTIADQPEAWARFDEAVAAQLGGNFAVSVAVAVDGRVVHTLTLGQRDIDDPARGPALPTDRFRVASISKVLTASVAMQLVDEGLVGLDEPVLGRVAELLGGAPLDGTSATITLRQLLSHTSGYGAFQPWFFQGGVSSCQEAAGRAIAGPPEAGPGSRFKYSNLNFCLVALVIEQATGLPYEQAVRTRLLEPLGITGDRIAGTYDVQADEVRHPAGPNRNYMETLMGSGSWVMTAGDVVSVLSAIDPSTTTWRSVSPESALEMMTRQPGVGQPDPKWTYGLGLMLFANGWGHTGTIENTRTMTLYGPGHVAWSAIVDGASPDRSSHLNDVITGALATSGVDLTPA